MFRPTILLLMLTLLVAMPASVMADDGNGCVTCHNITAENIQEGDRTIQVKFDTERFKNSVHGYFECTECHEAFSGENFHFVPEGKVTPEVKEASLRIASKGYADPVAAAACLKCHGEIFTKVLDSVHGENIVALNRQDGPLCVDCHGSPHYVETASAATSPVNRLNVVNTCGSCHGNEELSAKYGIEVDVMETYRESFHGRKYALGHGTAPTCVDCHGSHHVLESNSPNSPVFGIGKIETCSKCHPGANEQFVAAITHKEAGFIPHYAEIGLILLVIGTIGFVMLHFLLEVFSDVRDSLFRRKPEHEDNVPNDTEEVERFNIHFRVQHVLLFTTFLVLAFTGWGLKYAHLEQSHWLIRLSGGAEMAGLIHRVAGVVLVLNFLYHAFYMASQILSGKLKWHNDTTVVPILKDAKDLVQNFKYYLGLSDKQAEYGKFSYKQKFDYWAVFWGMAIIGSSGLALAFPTYAAYVIPVGAAEWIWQLLGIMHSDEALLAVVFILFWHFYNEHLQPATFPMSWVWLTGKLTKKELRHHHPLEYKLMSKDKGASE